MPGHQEPDSGRALPSISSPPLFRHRPTMWSQDHPSAHHQRSLNGEGQTPRQARCYPASGPQPICRQTHLSRPCLMPVAPGLPAPASPDPTVTTPTLLSSAKAGPCLLSLHITALHKGAQPLCTQKKQFPHGLLLIVKERCEIRKKQCLYYSLKYLPLNKRGALQPPCCLKCSLNCHPKTPGPTPTTARTGAQTSKKKRHITTG